ncbi:MAG: hypothetical protein ACJA1I_000539 [Zhongshania marina]|jgi:hypothetical protein
MSNTSNPGLYKVGETSRHPTIRAKELNSQTASPGRWICEYSWKVDNPPKAEKIAHRALRKHHDSKEYFRIQLPEAISIIESAIGAQAAYNRAEYKRQKEAEYQKSAKDERIKKANREIDRHNKRLSNLKEIGPQYHRGLYVIATLILTVIITQIVGKYSIEDYFSVFCIVAFITYSIYINKKDSYLNEWSKQVKEEQDRLKGAVRSHPEYEKPLANQSKPEPQTSPTPPVKEISKRDRQRIAAQTRIFMNKK